MNKILSASCALVLAALISACASDGAATSGAAKTVVASGTMYCHKDRLHTVGNEHECNWTANAKDACDKLVPSSRISASAIAGEPVGANRCASGQWLVQVSVK